MCSVNEQFKLCSCGELTEEDLKDTFETSYWILYSLDPSKTTVVLGLIHSLDVFDPLQDKENKRIILKRLNQPNAFDFNPDLKEGDLLKLNFGQPKKDFRELSYTCIFKAGKWIFKEVDVFGIENEFTAKSLGKIETQH